MESLVSEVTRAMLASWVPGASRWDGTWFFSGQGGLMLEWGEFWA